MGCYCVCRDAGKNSSALQNRIKAMDKDRVREKMKANCSKGYLDVQKEKLSKLKESYMLDKTAWETVLSPSVEVFDSSPNCCCAWERHSSVSPSPGLCVRSCLRCRWLSQARAGRSAGRSAGCLLLPLACFSLRGFLAGLAEGLWCWVLCPAAGPCWWGCWGLLVPGCAAQWPSSSNQVFTSPGSGSRL